MARIDAYLRSIEKLAARGAILTSGQPIVLRLPDGDRNATQTVPHEQLVAMVREIAPPPALDGIDAGRRGDFEFDGGTQRYRFEVQPAPGRWTVQITAVVAPGAGPAPAAIALDTPAAAGLELLIERTTYDRDDELGVAPGGLDALLTAARRGGATDVYLLAGQAPVARIGGELTPLAERPLDADQLEADLSAMVSTEVRARWNEAGGAVFATGGGAGGRLRVTWSRDRHGTTAAIRLVAADAPALDRLGVPAGVERWLGGGGLILVVGLAGSGRSTAQAALVARVAAGRSVSIVTLEHPVEILLTSRRSAISQREVPTHVSSFAGGLGLAVREGANVISVSELDGPASAEAALEAARAGALVLVSVAAADAASGIEAVIALAGRASTPDAARGLLADTLVGALVTHRTPQGIAYGALAGSPDAAAYIRAARTHELPVA